MKVSDPKYLPNHEHFASGEHFGLLGYYGLQTCLGVKYSFVFENSKHNLLQNHVNIASMVWVILAASKATIFPNIL